MESKSANKVCESCGEPFGCGAKLEGCWCTELTLTEPQAESIKAKFNDCLCPQCLAKSVEKAAMKITYADGSTEVIEDAIRVDTQNFHEGMFDFYNKRGVLLRQISMSSDIKWDTIVAN